MEPLVFEWQVSARPALGKLAFEQLDEFAYRWLLVCPLLRQRFLLRQRPLLRQRALAIVCHRGI